MFKVLVSPYCSSSNRALANFRCKASVPVQISLLSSTSGKSYGSADAGASGHSKRSKQQAADAPAAGDNATVSATLEPRNWTQQAADVTDNLLDASKYKSLAVYAEVKLAEALDKAAKVQPDTVNEDGEVLPNSLKTAVCFQLLGELADFCGPFSKTLIAVRDQLLPAVYSSYAAAQATRPLQFDQMPWFSVAAHLQRDNNALLAQQEAFKRELAAHQAQMSAVEQQLLTFKAAIDAGEAAVAALTATNASLIAARDAAVDDAAAAAEEEKRLADEVARLKDALLEVQGQLDNSKDNAAQDKEEWMANLAVLKKQIIIEQQEKEAAVSMVATRITTDAELQDLQERCLEAELKLEEAEQRLAAAASLTLQQHTLTPRPHWGPDQDLADRCRSTAETVSQLQQRHLETVTALQRQITLSQALHQPDPAPKPWTLSLRTETLNYFITEGALNPSDITDHEGLVGGLDGRNPGGKPQLFAEGLGLGSNIPRFFRCDQPVELHECDVDKLQRQIRDIWVGRFRFELQHGQCSLQEYQYHHFAAAAAAAAAPSGSSSDDTMTSSSAAAAAGYSFYHACCSHRSQNVLVDTIWHILTGQLPDSILAEQQQQVAAVGQLLEDLLARSAAAGAAAGGGGGDASEAKQPGVSQSDLSSSLRFLYPLKPQEQIADLTACIAAACSINSSRRTTGDKSGRDGCLDESCLQQLVGAVQTAAKGYPVIIYDTSSTSSVAGSGGKVLQDEKLHLTVGEAKTEAQTHAASETTAAAAAAKVVECLLRHHLQAVLSFTQEVMQHVWDLLLPHGDRSRDGGSSGSSGQPSDAAWQDVAEYLQRMLSQGSSSSDSSSQGKSSIRSRSGAQEDLPLLATAAAAAAATLVQRSDSEGARGHGKSISSSASTLSSTFADVKRWMQVAQQFSHADQQQGHEGLDVAALVQWLQREVLLQPVSCLTDTAAAVQFCKTLNRNSH